MHQCVIIDEFKRVTVRKLLSLVLASVTLTSDLWLWPLARNLAWSLVITPENFMMMRWWEHSQKRCDRRTDRRTENTIHRAVRSQLKNTFYISISCRPMSGLVAAYAFTAPCYIRVTLQRRHNGCDSISNHEPHDCLLNRLFRRR